MCLAIPGKVISIAGSPAALSKVDGCAFDELWGEVLFSEGASDVKEGVRRQVNLSYVPEIAVGDYVIVHAGFAISQLDEEEAKATLALFLSGDDFQ